jgi:hypothetical protein
VLSDTGPPLIMMNRLIPAQRGCPILMDPMGADLALSHGLKPDTGAARSPAVESMWWHAFEHAQYVLLKCTPFPRVAWTPLLRTYFSRHFMPILNQAAARGPGRHSYTLYRRVLDWSAPADPKPSYFGC